MRTHTQRTNCAHYDGRPTLVERPNNVRCTCNGNRTLAHSHSTTSCSVNVCAGDHAQTYLCVLYFAHTNTHRQTQLWLRNVKWTLRFSHIRSPFSPAHYKFIINSLVLAENSSVREYELQLTAAAAAVAASALAAHTKKRVDLAFIHISLHTISSLRSCRCASVCATLCVATAAHRRQTHTHTHMCIHFKRITVIALACKCCSLSWRLPYCRLHAIVCVSQNDVFLSSACSIKSNTTCHS